LDTITWNPTVGADATKKFYRLATAADFDSTDANGTIAATEVHGKLVEWDGTNNDFILEISDAVSDAANVVKSYMQYSFDSNDQFRTGGSSTDNEGTPSNMSDWEDAMVVASLASGGTANDIVYIDYGSGISTDINVFTQN
jgi:hypothetical protein